MTVLIISSTFIAKTFRGLFKCQEIISNYWELYYNLQVLNCMLACRQISHWVKCLSWSRPPFSLWLLKDYLLLFRNCPMYSKLHIRPFKGNYTELWDPFKKILPWRITVLCHMSTLHAGAENVCLWVSVPTWRRCGAQCRPSTIASRPDGWAIWSLWCSQTVRT